MFQFITALRNLFKIYNWLSFIYQINQNYVNGIVEYIHLNEIRNSRWNVIKTNMYGIYDEAVEVINEILAFNIRNTLYELLDLYHSILIFIVFLVFPKSLWISKDLWNIVFYLSLFATPMKHGIRYSKYHCIRSPPHCMKRTHMCRSFFKIVPPRNTH